MDDSFDRSIKYLHLICSLTFSIRIQILTMNVELVRVIHSIRNRPVNSQKCIHNSDTESW
jgi:hypothetical protein